MRKIAVAAAFMICLSASVSAQEDIRFGFQSSPTFGWMNSNTNRINSSGTNLGLKLGMIGEFYFRENYAFTSGIGFWFNAGGTLLHEHQGIYWNPEILPPGTDTLPGMVKLKYGIQFVEIPVGLKMRTREFGFNRFFIEPALTLGFKTQARGTARGAGLGEEITKLNIRKEVGPLNMAWGLNGGIERAISESTSLLLGLGFQVGFFDLTRDRNWKVFVPNRPEMRENSKDKANSLIVRIGILF